MQIIPRPQGFLIFWRSMLKTCGHVDTESRLFNIMENIIEEIGQARHYFSYEGKECNTVIIPMERRNEIETVFMNGFSTGLQPSRNGKFFVFGCEILYSADTDKIKVGYTV